MKKLLFLFFFTGILLFASSPLLNQISPLKTQALAAFIVPCNPNKNTCAPGSTVSCKCGGTAQCVNSNISGGACWQMIGSCNACPPTPTPKPKPPVCNSSNCAIFCTSSCDEYNAVCSGSNCVKGSTLIANNTSACSWAYTCPQGCRTNADCADQYTCNSGSPQEACHQYDDKCNVSTGKCVINLAASHNSNFIGCGSSCPYAPQNPSAVSSCSGTTPVTTFSWDPVVYTTGYSVVWGADREHQVSSSACSSGRCIWVGDSPVTSGSFAWYVYGNTASNADTPTKHSASVTTSVPNCAAPTPTFTPTPKPTATPTPTPKPPTPTPTLKPGVPTPTFTPTPTPTSAPSTSIISGNVYDDNNGNAVKDSGEAGHQNATIKLSTGQTTTTAANGNYTLNNLTAATRTITLTVPANYTATTANPRSITVPPNQTVNFGIRALGPTCTSLTFNPNTPVTAVGDTRTLTLTCSGVTGIPTYNWNASAGNVPPTSAGSSVTWTATQATIQSGNETVAGQVCDQATGLCSSSIQIQIPVTVSYSILGNVFLDGNKDTLKNSGEGDYSGSITISSGGSGAVTYPSAGAFRVANLNAGTYNISYSGLPSGYTLTYPLNGPPPSFSVTVGPSCSASGSNSASCDGSGNVNNLNFGITNSNPWIQSIGGDITGDNISNQSGGGFTDQIPSGASCGSYGSYATVSGPGGTPGIVYSGAGTANFGSGQASQNPYNWVVGGLSYPNVYTPSTAGIIKTSYSYIDSVAKQANLTENNLANVQGCSNLANCQLPVAFGNGIYKAAGSVTLTGPNYTFPVNKNFVILVNGDLTIKTQLHVPIGSTLMFTVSGNIYVDPSVGESVITNTTPDLEGYFSTDKSFYAQGTNVCPTADLRLNVAGSVVVNAALSGGSFVNERDLCAGDNQCPVFSIQERPDFVLNAPNFLETVRRVWQEVAP